MATLEEMKGALLNELESATNNVKRGAALVKQIEQCKNRDQVRQICQEFKDYDLSIVDQSLGHGARLKQLERMLTEPRKAIKAIDTIPAWAKSKDEKYIGQHCALEFCQLTTEESAIRDTYNSARRDLKVESSKPGNVTTIDATEIIALGQELAGSDKPAAIALGIQILTGRRINEVYMGSFEVHDTYLMIFNGQSKKGANSEAATSDYLIPTLADSRMIKVAHDRLTHLCGNEISKWYAAADKAKAFNSSGQYRKTLAIVKESIDPLLPAVAVKSSTHKSRSFYARCIMEYARPDHSHAGVLSGIVTRALGDTELMGSEYGHYTIVNLPNIAFQATHKTVGKIPATSIKSISLEFSNMTVALEDVVSQMSDRQSVDKLRTDLDSGKTLESLLADALTLLYKTRQGGADNSAQRLSAKEKLEKIMYFIFENNKDAADHLSKLELTGSVLSQIAEQVWGSAIPSVTLKTFLATWDLDITTHYEEVGISAGHNLRVLRSEGLIPVLVGQIAGQIKSV